MTVSEIVDERILKLVAEIRTFLEINAYTDEYGGRCVELSDIELKLKEIEKTHTRIK